MAKKVKKNSAFRMNHGMNTLTNAAGNPTQFNNFFNNPVSNRINEFSERLSSDYSQLASDAEDFYRSVINARTGTYRDTFENQGRLYGIGDEGIDPGFYDISSKSGLSKMAKKYPYLASRFNFQGDFDPNISRSGPGSENRNPIIRDEKGRALSTGNEIIFEDGNYYYDTGLNRSLSKNTERRDRYILNERLKENLLNNPNLSKKDLAALNERAKEVSNIRDNIFKAYQSGDINATRAAIDTAIKNRYGGFGFVGGTINNLAGGGSEVDAYRNFSELIGPYGYGKGSGLQFSSSRGRERMYSPYFTGGRAAYDFLTPDGVVASNTQLNQIKQKFPGRRINVIDPVGFIEARMLGDLTRLQDKAEKAQKTQNVFSTLKEIEIPKTLRSIDKTIESLKNRKPLSFNAFNALNNKPLFDSKSGEYNFKLNIDTKSGK
jgi:hypothetical protein